MLLDVVHKRDELADDDVGHDGDEHAAGDHPGADDDDPHLLVSDDDNHVNRNRAR